MSRAVTEAPVIPDAPAPEPSAAQAAAMLGRMLEIRRFDEYIIEVYQTDVMVTPVHLHIGQEAVPVGLCAHLRDADTLFFGHRTHGPSLAKGLEIKRLMAELYGRSTGCARGFGGSMHVVDPSHGLLGTSAIVGGAIALGVGSALAAKLAGEDRIAVSFFGDAASNSGVFWESMNFAALKQLPVLFVCENNNLSNTMLKADHMFADLTKVASNFMPALHADGTDPVSVFGQAARAVEYVRTQGKPAFIECLTKRWTKHQGIDYDDLDYNPIDKIKDDPILKLRDFMIRRGMLSDAQFQRFRDDAAAKVEAAVQFAVNSPFPDEAELLEEV